MRKLYFFLIFLCTLMYSCQEELSTITTETTTSVFTTISGTENGLDFTNQLTPTPALNILEYLYYYNGGGVAIGDLNNDGLEDVFLTANQSADQLFLNKGDLNFENHSTTSGISASDSWSSGVTIDDVNGDGLLDIYICKVSPVSRPGTHNLLYINNGDMKFTESAQLMGLDFSGYSTQAAFFDYDKDGDLDMYLLNHSVHSVSSYGKTDKRDIKDPLSGDRLYENKLNEAESKFVDVTEAAGIYSSALGYGLGIIAEDLNQDGWTDIYVGNDFHENDYIYLNDGNKKFTESSKTLLNHSSKFTMGVDVADLNEDGLPDIFTTDMLPYDNAVALRSGGEDTDQIFNIRSELGFQDQYARNHLQLQTPARNFSDLALMTNTFATDWSWSVLLQDFDKNGLNDIFITNGIVKRPNDLDYINFINNNADYLNQQLNPAQLDTILAQMPTEKLKNVLFLQNEPLDFSELSASQTGPAGFSNGAAYADLDQDGDLDIIINNINSPASILKNNASASSHYIKFQLPVQTAAQTSKGTIVQLFYNNKKTEKTYTTTRGYQSSGTHRIFFGLGAHTKIDSVVFIWPDTKRQVLMNPEADQLHIIKKSEDLPVHKWENNTVATIALNPTGRRHIENAYLDYNHDKLIPEFLSREGPAVVYADFNQDGIKDLYMGGAAYQEAGLYFGKENGFGKKIENAEFKRDGKYEDVDAAALDFDQDGDLDLYVVSGGNDEKELSKRLEDRLYLNDGKGNLKRLPLSLPHTNGGSIAIGDFDGDKFPDLFIGARSIPGSYGLSPFSFLLKNKGGFGLELVKKERYGMITDSHWADIDNDADLDLIFCGDWMKIAVLENQGDGSFQYKSDEFGFANSAGLWNDVTLHDFNEDGQLDILAGNAGKNFKWKASRDQPIHLSVADLDANGQTEPLIFYPYFSQYRPYAGLDQLKGQVPAIRKQFLSYKSYTDVKKVSDFKLLTDRKIADKKEIQELRSMLYLSSNGTYESIPLPDPAQWSSIQDFMIKADGSIYFVGNNASYLTELGKNMENAGGLLKFDAATQQFVNYESLYLPKELNPRRIIALDNDKMLVVCNDDFAYIIGE